jgi:hypothetical protein
MKKFRNLVLFSISGILGLGLYTATGFPEARAQGDYSMVNTRDTVYINSCRGCHLAYSPGLLPMASWTEILAGLNQHFGVTVELDGDTSAHILEYLQRYALRPGQDTVMGQLADDLPDTAVLRITQLPTFMELHSNAAELLVFQSEEQAQLGKCESCHRAAASHIFDRALLQIGHGDGRLSDYK